MNLCIGCARKGGRRDGCLDCALIAPKPRFQIVRDIISKVAQEHRLTQLRAEEDFKADFTPVEWEGEAAKATARYRAKCRRRKNREKTQALEVK